MTEEQLRKEASVILGSVNEYEFACFEPETLLVCKIQSDGILILKRNRNGWNRLWNGQAFRRVRPDIYPKLNWDTNHRFEIEDTYEFEMPEMSERTGSFEVHLPNGYSKRYEWVTP